MDGCETCRGRWARCSPLRKSGKPSCGHAEAPQDDPVLAPQVVDQQLLAGGATLASLLEAVRICDSCTHHPEGLLRLIDPQRRQYAESAEKWSAGMSHIDSTKLSDPQRPLTVIPTQSTYRMICCAEAEF